MLHGRASTRLRRLITKDEGYEDHDGILVFEEEFFVFFACYEPS